MPELGPLRRASRRRRLAGAGGWESLTKHSRALDLRAHHHKGGTMKFARLFALAGLGAALVLTGAVWADTKVEVKKVHLCCGNCVKTVGEILSKVEGVTGMCDQKAGTVT